MKAAPLFFLVFFASCVVASVVASFGAPTDFFSDADESALRTRLIEQLQRRTADEALREEDYYAVAALATLSPKDLAIPQSAQLCAQARRLLDAQTSAKKADPQALHRSLGVIAALKCESPAPAALTALGEQLVSKVLAVNGATVLVDVHAALAALQQIQRTQGAKVVIAPEVAETVAERIAELMDADGHFVSNSEATDEEPTATSSGLAFHSLAILKRLAALDAKPAPKVNKEGKEEPGKLDESVVAAREHIRTVAASASALLAEADEEDDQIIEFEDRQSPLRATALFWIGAEALARSGEGITATDTQIAKLAEFFLRNKRVADPIDAYYLVRALKTVANNAFKKSPLAVTIPNPSILTSAKGEESLLKIRVSDVFGKFAGKATVLLTKVYPAASPKQVLVHNQQATLSAGNDNTLYTFNLLAAKPDQGLYSVELSVSPEDKGSPVFGAVGVARGVKVVVTADLSDVSIQVADAIEEEDAELASRVSYPDTLPGILKANPLQHVLVNFRVRSQGRPLPVQQAFVVFRHEESGHEVIVTAIQTANKYKAHLNLREAARAFQGRSGKYSVHLLVGDAFLNRPYFWHMADIILSVAKLKEESAAVPSDDALKGLKPEIQHKFRTPEKRPPPPVSLAFTIIVVAVPALVLLVGLFMIGANISNFPLSGTGFLSAVGFHACIIAIIALYVFYWLQLTMVETLVYLGGLGVVTVLVGWQALRNRYYARTGHAKKD